MRILNLQAHHEGCWYVRNHVPLRHLGYEFEDKDYIQDYDYDIVVFNRSIPHDTYLYLDRFKAAGAKIVYDTDDLLMNIPETSPVSSIPESNRAVRLIPRILEYADVVTCTTEPLKKQLERFYDGRIEVLENCIDPKDWKKRKNKPGLRVGWAGSVSHIEDLLLITDVVRDLQKDHDFEFVIFGITPKSLEEDIIDMAKQIGKKLTGNERWVKLCLQLSRVLSDVKFRHVLAVDIDKYHKKLADVDFDIGLCPLVDTRFNRCKSPIKFYEYVSVGTVCMASRVIPYEGVVNYTAKNRYDKWKTKLQALIEDEGLRKNVLKEQAEYVKTKDIRNHINKWREVYESL